MAGFELIAAAHTPLDPGGDLNLEAVPAQAEHFRASGVDGVLVAGSTGEGSSLTGDERRQLAERWGGASDGLRLIIHVGHQSTREARELAAHAAASGAQAVCAAPPSWFPLRSVEGLVDVCEEIAAGAPELPFLYYHIPALSHVDVPMARLLDQARDRIPNFSGVKYTHLDPVDFQACVRDHGEDAQLLWGCDELLVTGLALGADGAVGSSYSFAAPLYRRLIAAHARGDVEGAQALQSQAALLVETLARRGYAAAAKAVMGFLEVECGPVRPPLPRLDMPAKTALRADLEGIGFFDWIRGPDSR